jgi:hypothetical protein
MQPQQGYIRGFIPEQEAFDSVDKLADGEWLNDTNIQVGCMAVKDCLAPLPCSEQVVVMGPDSIRCIQSWIPGGIGRKGRRLMEVVNKGKASVGVFGDDAHWVAFVTKNQAAAASMCVVDSIAAVDGRVHLHGEWDGSIIEWGGLAQHNSSRLIMLAAHVLCFHYTAWGREPGTTADLVIVGLGQQIDGWFCGRWALANLAVLYENICSDLHMLRREQSEPAVAFAAAEDRGNFVTMRRRYATCSNKQMVKQFIIRLMHVGYCFEQSIVG